MNHARLMGFVQGLGNLHTHGDGLGNWQLPSAEPILQALALNKVGDDVDRATLDANFVDDGSGNLSPGMPDEKMGTSFEIVEGATTSLTIRTNLDTLDWNDADDNGEWTEGVDELANWTTIPGTDTMVDYIVE